MKIKVTIFNGEKLEDHTIEVGGNNISKVSEDILMRRKIEINGVFYNVMPPFGILKVEEVKD